MTTDQSMLVYLSANELGEVLRTFTFVGEGVGCYSNFEVREDAEKWTALKRALFWKALDWEDAHECASLGEGFTFTFMGLSVDCCWFWDGDGVLAYVVSGPDEGDPLRVVQTTDCKKDYRWEDQLGTAPVVEL